MIAQGVYGTAGGLDQNTERVDDALNLIKSSLQRATSGTLPFGAELSGNMEQLQIDIGYHRFPDANGKRDQYKFDSLL